MPKFRSPVLGFNHNIRHKGWVFHVQTEDSGIANPHIFTHLFREGVILASKKCEYDAESDVDVVKALMQAQHKSVMKQLKGGVFDEKIKKYLGDAPPDYEEKEDTPPPAAAPAAAKAPAVAAAPPAPAETEEDDVDVSGVFRKISEQPIPEPAIPIPPPKPTTARPAGPPPPAGTAAGTPAPNKPLDVSGQWVIARPGRAERPFDRQSGNQPTVRAPSVPPPALPEVPQPGSPAARKRPTVPPASQPGATPPAAAGPRRPLPQQPLKPSAPTQPIGSRKPQAPLGRSQENPVVVARPAVVIGAPPTVIGGSAPAQPGAEPGRRPGASHARETVPPAATPENIFGQDLISEKSLDEVIMAYLSEDSSEE